MIDVNVTGSFTEIYVGGGNSLTENWPTNFHTFAERRVLAPGQTVADFREVTAKEREAIEAQDAKWVEPQQWLIDLFESYCTIWGESYLGWQTLKTGGHNRSTGFFECNYLKDITTQQAIDIVRFGMPFTSASGTYDSVGYSTSIRTCFQPNTKSNWSCKLNTCFHGSGIESLVMPKAKIGGNMSASKLRILYCDTVLDNTVTAYLPALETFRCNSLARGMGHFERSAKLNLSSVRHIVGNIPSGTTDTQMRVHKDVHAKLTGDTSNAAAAALTAEELAQWAEVAQTAIEKHIIITT